MMTWGQFKECVEAGHPGVTDDTPLEYIDVQLLVYSGSGEGNIEVLVEKDGRTGKRMYVRN